MLELDRIYRERGWPDVLLYVEDEIDGHPSRMRKAREALTRLKAASPNIKTTTALGMRGAEALGHMYDVWIGCSSPEMIEKCAAMGKHPWTYSCRGILQICSAYERYFFGLYPWKIGLKGVGLWCYTDGKVFYDRFGRNHGYRDGFVFTPECKQRHGHAYFEGDQIIPVVTWEAVREGIDDYRYMLTLKKAARAALSGQDTAGRAAAEAGLALLREIAERTDLTPALNDFGGSEYVKDPTYMPDMDAERSRVIDAVLRIEAAARGTDEFLDRAAAGSHNARSFSERGTGGGLPGEKRHGR